MSGGLTNTLMVLLSFISSPSYSQTSCFENEAVRLVGGLTEREGRVEVCLSLQWGTICDELWSNEDAQVVCRQLSLPTRGAVAVRGNQFNGDSSAQIWLNNFQCTGVEAKLLQCSSNQLGLDNCRHENDAGVTCPTDTTCEFGEARLSDGSTLSGRVEVCVNDSWSAVCDMSWSNADTTVLCRQLGHSASGARVLISLQTPDGIGPIWRVVLQCQGTESRVAACPTMQSDVINNCGHDDDIGVSCLPSDPVCSEGSVRLLGGSDVLSGRVEICRQNEWGSVCDRLSTWSVASATVVCRQLGFSTEGSLAVAPGSSLGSTGVFIWLENVLCSGSERSLTECDFTGLVSPSCMHNQDVGVRCQPQQSCDEGRLRLAGGRTSNEGRVEICFDNEWGTVCDDSWGSPDATVVCSQLGLPSSASIAVPRAGFGSASDSVRILLDNVHCTGSEPTLLDCEHSSVGMHNCGHIEDAGVICQGFLATSAHAKGAVRLIGGTVSSEGRVEVFQNNQWGTVCGLQWDEADARVLCRQLGFSSVGAMPVDAMVFGAGVGQIWLSNVQCSGSESRLVECPSSTGVTDYRCYHSSDAGVRCQADNIVGPPNNLRVIFSSVNCSHVTILWEPPVDEQSITGYTVTVTGVSEPVSGEQTFLPLTESLELTSISCCSSYSYRVSARVAEQDITTTVSSTATFRTNPDLSDPILVAVNVINDTSLAMRWLTPAAVTQQGVASYFASVTSECFTIEQKGQPQNISIPSNGRSQFIAGRLEPFVPYRVILNATVCGTTVQIYNQILYTQRNVVRPPVIEGAQHNTPTSVAVSFQVPSSEQNADYFEVSYYNYTGSTFQQGLVVQTFRTSNQSLIIHDLDPCLNYWVLVAAINCGSSVDSSPKLVDLREAVEFLFIIVLEEEEDEECRVWVMGDQVLVDVRRGVTSQLARCQLAVPCTANNTLSCGKNHTNVEYRTTLVSVSNSSAAEQAACLRDWVTDVRTIQIQGRILATSLSVSPVEPGGNKENLVYVWALLGIILTGIVVATGLVLSVIVLRKLKKQDRDDEHKLEDIDSPADPSLNVTENKLYRSHSGGLTDSGRGSSGVEDTDGSEASFKKNYPLHFGPPEY